MELKIKIDVKGALLTGKAPDIVQKNLEEAITRATNLLHNEVLNRTPQGALGAQGGLINSIKGDVLLKGTPMVKGVIVTKHPYAEVIEKGRRPGKGIPVNALIPWLIGKLKITDEKELARANFLIRRKIKAQGFKGAHMFEKALNENYNKVEAIFRDAGFNIAKELSE